MIINSRFFNRSELIGFVTLAVVLFLILPLTLDVFRLNLVAKYLTYAFVAIGLVLCWGYGGILSLGQGVFFGLGGYCMAMYLKLEASSVDCVCEIEKADAMVPSRLAAPPNTTTRKVSTM